MSDYWVLRNKVAVAVEYDEWLKWAVRPFEETKRVAKTLVGEVEVSTVFLAVNHNWGSGPPILFETMIFGGPSDEYQWRYSTWNEAEVGHQAVVDALRNGTELPE